MAIYLYVADLNLSVYSAYWNGVWRGDVPLNTWPAAFAHFASNQGAEPIQTVNAGPWSPYNPNKDRDETYRCFVGGNLPILQPSKSVVTLTEIKGKDPHFREKARLGEMVVTDRQTGSVEITRVPGLLLTSPRNIGLETAGYTAQHWYSYADLSYDKVYTAPNIKLSQISDIRLYWKRYTVSGTQTLLPIPEIPDLTAHPTTELVTSAYARAQSGYWDVMTEIAELPETLKFLRGAMSDILVLSEDFKTRAPKLGKLTALGEKAAKHWLAYRYALMPIFYSIMDVQKALANFGRMYSKYKEVGGGIIDAPLLNGSLYPTNTSEKVDRCFIKNKYDALSFCNRLISILDFNMASTAYELTSLSLVLDWVINAGDFIKAVTAPTTSDDQVCTFSTKTSGQWSYFSPVDGARVLVDFNTYSRKVIIPSDYIGLAFDVNYSWKRQVDTVALSFSAITNKARSLK